MTQPDEWLKVESLDLEAQGVAHNSEGKVVFIEDALAGEEVQVHVHRRKNNWEQATATVRRRDSSQRVVPRCPHFGLCGGCKMQHLHIGAQVATKQRALEDALWHLGKVKPEQLLRPIEGRPGAIANAPGCRFATSSRKARCWSASTSASRATSPTWTAARCCRAP
jgi:23S rRNA (uracil1939-C5)-methyltransferase